MQETAKIIGVNVSELSEKCSRYSQEYLLQVTKGGLDRKKLINLTKDTFTYDELLYMSLNWMNEKTEQTFIEILKGRKTIKDENSN